MKMDPRQYDQDLYEIEHDSLSVHSLFWGIVHIQNHAITSKLQTLVSCPGGGVPEGPLQSGNKKKPYDSISVILHCSLQKNVFLILDQVKIGVPSPSINQLMYCVKGKEEIDRMGYMGFILVLFYDKSEDCLTSMPRYCNTVFLYQYEHPQTLFNPALRIRALPLQFCCIKF